MLRVLKSKGLKANLIFGDMSPEERDEQVSLFRRGEIKTVITTNLLSRGLDIPEIELVINFDVPIQKDRETGVIKPDYENYLHRIGRAGRFGINGVALSIYDRPDDE